MTVDTFSAEAALKPLKKFQRDTVEYAFRRLYLDEGGTNRFLVADEVGLGKTLVARGVIAKTIEYLRDKQDRIDIIYICSNQAIAHQNLKRLNVLGQNTLSAATRITLIPFVRGDLPALSESKVNFISLTPSTTFDLKSSKGVKQERAFLYHLLSPLIPCQEGFCKLLQCSVGDGNWKWEVSNLNLDKVEASLIERFRQKIQAETELFEEVIRLSELYRAYNTEEFSEPVYDRNALIGELRRQLATVCLDALKPDLIILDEFQRFKHVLNQETDHGELARELLSYSGEGVVSDETSDVRVLMLSATPYKKLTLSGDADEDGDHYDEFLFVLKFLYDDPAGESEVIQNLPSKLKSFRRALQQLPSSKEWAAQNRDTIQTYLKAVMVRRERVRHTSRQDAMLEEVKASPVQLTADDLRNADAVSRVAMSVSAPNNLEYWKSAPYLLNFMQHYKLKQLMKEQLPGPLSDYIDAMNSARPSLLNRERISDYQPIDPGNGRMRRLMEDLFGQGEPGENDRSLHRHLWLPPSLPYYDRKQRPCDGSSEQRPLTKSLIFSSWSMVPDAISALVTYEAERLMGCGQSGHGYFDQYDQRPLQFQYHEDRPTGLRNLLLLYPSPTLASEGDPFSVFSDHETGLTYQEMRTSLTKRIQKLLSDLGLQQSSQSRAHGELSTIPLVLDAKKSSRLLEWVTSAEVGLLGLSKEEGYQKHCVALADKANEVSEPRVSQEDLDLLVDLCLGSPAVCALRSLRRIAPEIEWENQVLLTAAAKVAWAFRFLFNQQQVVELVRKEDKRGYWNKVLQYCARHNLQAVLDEYAHCLVENEGLSASEPEEKVRGVAEAMANALTIKPSQIHVDWPQVKDGQVTIAANPQMRGRFAMRFADYKDEEGESQRVDKVRSAFNSPFRPFVLATTSIGQEGLDFHPYCYRIYHWNLPSNPVDLEQREGRIHRFKGHAVRLNLANKHVADAKECNNQNTDPWTRMFQAAQQESDSETGLIPYWIYEGDTCIERVVPMFPYSREEKQLEWLKRSLAVYRLAFGQPRQEDLLDYLNTLQDEVMNVDDLSEFQIELLPAAV
ncbi:DEAD/DEAH box helicase [Fodinicurvata halophila]|uniref:DEAD/DEAH box helicase n=1 Tax=Fodinicurvata halophila TaxID=1419723 RepID=A0ABV8UP10_9PROT